MIIKKEWHIRADFAAKQMEQQVKKMAAIKGSFAHSGIASSKASKKFIQSKRIYDYYVRLICYA